MIVLPSAKSKILGSCVANCLLVCGVYRVIPIVNGIDNFNYNINIDKQNCNLVFMVNFRIDMIYNLNCIANKAFNCFNLYYSYNIISLFYEQTIS